MVFGWWGEAWGISWGASGWGQPFQGQFGCPYTEGSTCPKESVRAATSKDSYPQSWATLQPFGASPLIPLIAIIASALHRPCWALENLPKAPWFPCLMEVGPSRPLPMLVKEDPAPKGQAAGCIWSCPSAPGPPRPWQRTEVPTTSLSPPNWRGQGSSHLFAHSCLFSGCVFLFTFDQQPLF